MNTAGNYLPGLEMAQRVYVARRIHHSETVPGMVTVYQFRFEWDRVSSEFAVPLLSPSMIAELKRNIDYLNEHFAESQYDGALQVKLFIRK